MFSYISWANLNNLYIVVTTLKIVKLGFKVYVFLWFKIGKNYNSRFTPFENAQRWMGKNTFPILLLNDDDMIGEH